MGQQKIKLEFIEDDRKRKTTYKVRQKGIIKKVRELSILCDIHACAIIYSPYDVEPMVWPSPMGVQQVISEYNNMPEMEKNNRSANHASFLRKMIGKIDGQMKRQQTQNHENELTQMMIDGMLIGDEMLEGLFPSGLNDLGSKVDKILDEVNIRIDCFTAILNDALVIPPEDSVTPQQYSPYSLPSFPQQLDSLGMEQVGDQNIQPEGLNYWLDQYFLDDLIYADEAWNNQVYPNPNPSNDPTLPYVEPNPNFFDSSPNLP